MSTSPSGYRVRPAVETGSSDKVRTKSLNLNCVVSVVINEVVPTVFPLDDWRLLTCAVGVECDLLSTQGCP
jgi:hypothetical protein